MTQKPSIKSHTPVPSPNATTGNRFIARNGLWLGVATAGAALSVGAALFNRASARRAEAATPPAGTFVEVDGVRLHFVDRGQGPVVVVLHGNAVMLQDFEASGVLGLAAAGHRVIAFDRPGYGYSDRPRSRLWSPTAQADLLVRALGSIGVENAVVVGHSWGTLVALAMALDHPELVGGLVLISGYYYGTARPDVLPASMPAVPVIGDVMAATVSPLAGRVIGPTAIKASFAPAPVPDKFAAFPVEMTLRPSQVRATAADAAIMVPAAIALSHRYGELTVPIVVMAGDGDLIVHRNKHAERLAAAVASAELRVVPEQGHLLHFAVPDQVVMAIDDVIARS